MWNLFSNNFQKSKIELYNSQSSVILKLLATWKKKKVSTFIFYWKLFLIYGEYSQFIHFFFFLLYLKILETIFMIYKNLLKIQYRKLCYTMCHFRMISFVRAMSISIDYYLVFLYLQNKKKNYYYLMAHVSKREKENYFILFYFFLFSL